MRSLRLIAQEIGYTHGDGLVLEQIGEKGRRLGALCEAGIIKIHNLGSDTHLSRTLERASSRAVRRRYGIEKNKLITMDRARSSEISQDAVEGVHFTIPRDRFTSC